MKFVFYLDFQIRIFAFIFPKTPEVGVLPDLINLNIFIITD